MRSACGLLDMTPEFIAHGGEQLVGERRLATRAKTLVERGRKDRGRHRLVDRGLDCPASFARVRNPARKLIERGILGQRSSSEIKEPRRDDTAASPYFRDIAQIEIVAIELGIAQWRGFGIGR